MKTAVQQPLRRIVIILPRINENKKLEKSKSSHNRSGHNKQRRSSSHSLTVESHNNHDTSLHRSRFGRRSCNRLVFSFVYEWNDMMKCQEILLMLNVSR